MSDSILGIGLSALAAAQAGLTTTGHNISNVNTPGYSRQEALQTTKSPLFTGGGYVGQGVDVELGEVDLVLEVALGPLGDLGRDGLARAAPRRERVEHHHLVLGDGLLELIETVWSTQQVLVTRSSYL